MVQLWRTWNRLVLTVAFAAWSFVLWRSVIGLDRFVLFHINAFPVTIYWFSRVFITVALALAYRYFFVYCVVGQREEHARIVHKG
ncbi:MAG: hypothetical protein ACRDHW_07130 [Ktedonobacteraceae bacterium]